MELITATEEFNEMGTKVFPNPTAEYINLALEKSQPALVRLTDSMGKLVLETSVSGYENKLDVSKLSSGTYLLLVEQGLNRSVFKIRKD
ncbi:T9SS type A sorting domain-containing protein [Pseudarcicella hirudinis]|uniref:T9SS type A sorting domain-containing protein n=1 Tax=Pseudarcicella hirudinis TaxID=1079859 RepID=UPI0035ED1276